MTPELSEAGSVLLQALRLRDTLRYDEVASLCDLESAVAFQQRQLDAFKRPTAEDVLRDNPEASLDRAEAIARAMGELIDQQKRALEQALPRVSYFDELASLDPIAFLSRWIEGNDSRYEMLRRIRAAGRPVPDSLRTMGSGGHYEITRGEALDESSVRIWYREAVETVEGNRYGPENSETLRRGPTGQWRLEARALLLHQGASTQTIPLEIADLFKNDG